MTINSDGWINANLRKKNAAIGGNYLLRRSMKNIKSRKLLAKLDLTVMRQFACLIDLLFFDIDRGTYTGLVSGEVKLTHYLV